MLNLIKYEFIRKYKLIIMVLFSALAFNLYLITKGIAGSTMFLVFFPLLLSVLYLVDIIKMYSDDLNKKTGYMLFMTPNSGYKIICSKLLTAILEGLGILLIYFFFFIANSIYIIISLGIDISFTNILLEINKIFSVNLGYSFNILYLFASLLLMLIFIIAFITTIYTAITVRKSIFSEVKLGGLLSFITFLVINWAITYISTWFYGLISKIIPYYESLDIIASTGRFTPENLLMVFLPMAIVSIIQIIALTASSGYLLENTINL